MAQSVAILGGGVGGMSAAHELVERGFEVELYESRDVLGGKARSIAVPGSGQAGRSDLPGEHGFRFFPGFYWHLPDTMGRIPTAPQQWVVDNLVDATQLEVAQAEGGPEVFGPARAPRSAGDLYEALRFLLAYATKFGIPPDELGYFLERLLLLMTSCERRRFEEYESSSWWQFSGAAERSPQYRKFLADGITRSLVAAQAREISARTGGYVLLQLIYDMARWGGRVDRVLNGPTNSVWIDPWTEYLKKRGVSFHLGHQAVGIHCTGNRITGVTVETEHKTRRIQADHYVAALPVELMRMLVSDQMKEADPKLNDLFRLRTRWMNGIMFYLERDVPLCHGHTIYIDSPWALTSISQAQFWPGLEVDSLGDGRASGILSVDVSDWESPGIVFGKVASKCSSDEIKREVWAQLKAHLNDDESQELVDSNVVSCFLDPDIQFPNPTGATNLEPLLINTVDSWQDRPEAVTRIENLFLAADYVRTYTDLATMEAACEAARRAVNGILDASGSVAEPCEIRPLWEPPIFAAARRLDEERFELERRHPGGAAGRLLELPSQLVESSFDALRVVREALTRLGDLCRLPSRGAEIPGRSGIE